MNNSILSIALDKENDLWLGSTLNGIGASLKRRTKTQ
jgi:hypothetical protein